ncbi:MAG: CPBP family intramembrane glutamic endopeptidase, partial [Deltaproteobacteria bacterium]
LAVPLVAYVFAARAVRPLRRTLTWWRRGRIDRATAGMMLGAVLVSSAALCIWLKWTHPYLGDLHAQLPDVGTLGMLGIGLAFALGNAVLEECVWRGVLLEALDAGLGRGVVPVVAQALSFGAAHVAGFPRGAWGVAMATAYGLMLGAIRRRSEGLLAPVITHAFADATIFALLLRYA